MRKTSDALIGILSYVFYYLVKHLNLLWDYNEKYALLQNLLLFVLPAIPGVAMAFLLIRDSLSDFFKSFGICFLASVCVIFINIIFRIDLMTQKLLTGYEEISLGAGLLMAIMSMSYIVSCFCGVVFAGIVSFYKQRKNGPAKN